MVLFENGFWTNTVNGDNHKRGLRNKGPYQIREINKPFTFQHNFFSAF